MLQDYASSPLGYWLRHIARTVPPKTSAALRHGTLLHLRHQLTPDEWQSRNRLAPDSVVTSTGQLGKAREKWLAGITVIQLLPLFIADSPGDELSKELPKPMHSGRKLPGIGQVEVVAIAVAVVIGLGAWPLGLGFTH